MKIYKNMNMADIIMEKKIHILKNILFMKSFTGLVIIGLSIWGIRILHDNYRTLSNKIDMAHHLVSETKIKLNEIKDNNININEGLKKYYEIANKTEEERCREYNNNHEKYFFWNLISTLTLTLLVVNSLNSSYITR